MLPHDDDHARDRRHPLVEPRVEGPVEKAGEEISEEQPGKDRDGKRVPGRVRRMPMARHPRQPPDRQRRVLDRSDDVKDDIALGERRNVEFADGVAHRAILAYEGTRLAARSSPANIEASHPTSETASYAKPATKLFRRLRLPGRGPGSARRRATRWYACRSWTRIAWHAAHRYMRKAR